MLTVYSVLWGNKYSKQYVYTLKNAVAANLKVPHKFVCLTDHKLDGINCVAPICAYEGWWQKTSLFEVANGPSLYFDLDSVIVGGLDYLVPYTNYKISAPANWAESGHGGIQSSVMAWNGEWKEPYRKLNYEEAKNRLWGDQEWLTELVGKDFKRIPHVYSYKYHCKPSCSFPVDASVITFHGKPDYHEVGQKWVKDYMSTYTSIL